MKPDPLTIAEHVALGAELHQIRLRLMEIHVDVAARYGNSKGVTDRARRAADALDRLRCDLDSQFCRDHPDAFFPQAYYPGATMPDTDTPAGELEPVTTGHQFCPKCGMPTHLGYQDASYRMCLTEDCNWTDV